MKKSSLGCVIVAYILIFIFLFNALRWTNGYDSAPVTAFGLSVPGGYGDLGIDCWRMLSVVWFSIYYFPPQGSLTTILDFTLPKWWFVVLFAAGCTVSALELFWLAMVGRSRAAR